MVDPKNFGRQSRRRALPPRVDVRYRGTACRWPAVGLPLACRWPAVGLPLACRWPAVGLPLACRWPAVGLPLACRWPAVGLPLACRWPAVGLPLACRWPAVGLPLACRWPAVGLPLACRWPAAPASGTHPDPAWRGAAGFGRARECRTRHLPPLGTGHGCRMALMLCGYGAVMRHAAYGSSGDIMPASGADAFTMVYDITHTNRYIST